MFYDFMTSFTNMVCGESEQINLAEMDKLAKGLDEKGIEYTRKPLYDGEQILVEGHWDAICHRGSYGHEDGLLEIMGDIVQNEDDSVEGCLTADEILSRV